MPDYHLRLFANKPFCLHNPNYNIGIRQQKNQPNIKSM